MQETYLFVLPWTLEYVGGVNQVVLNLARAAQADGRYRPLVLIADGAARTPIFADYQGIPTVRWRLPGWPPVGPLSAIADRWVRRPLFNRAFAAFCREQRVRAINCHYFCDCSYGVASAMAASRMAIPLIVSVHGGDVTSMETGPDRLRAMATQVLQSCHAVVAPSQSLSRRCREAFGLSTAPRVVHNGLDLMFMSDTTETVAETRARVVLSIGRFDRKKAQDVLIEAFSRVVGEFENLELWLVGAAAPSLPELREQAARSVAAERIRFHVDVPHARIAALLSAASVFVLPSREEAFGIVLLEAGSLGVPVIATTVGGIPEVITDGETGRLVPPDDVDALAAAIREVLTDTDAAQARSSRLRMRVEQEFTWTRAYQSYTAILA